MRLVGNLTAGKGYINTHSRVGFYSTCNTCVIGVLSLLSTWSCSSVFQLPQVLRVTQCRGIVAEVLDWIHLPH